MPDASHSSSNGEAISPEPFSSDGSIGLLPLLKQSSDIVLTHEPTATPSADVPTRMKIALQHARDGKHQYAEAELREVIKMDPTFATAHHNLGVALAEQSKRDEAIPHFLESIKLFPDYFDAHRNLAGVYLSMGKKQEAINPLREALRLQPTKPELYNDLGFLLTDLERSSEGEVYLRQATRLKNDYALGKLKASGGLVKSRGAGKSEK